MTPSEIKTMVDGIFQISSKSHHSPRSVSDVFDLPDLRELAWSIINTQFHHVRNLHEHAYTRADIQFEVENYARNNPGRTCLFNGCENRCEGQFRYCNEHRKEINELAGVTQI